jgi:hypothetical protein
MTEYDDDMTQYDDVEVRMLLRKQIDTIEAERTVLLQEVDAMSARIMRYEAALIALNPNGAQKAEPEPRTRQERNRQSRLSPGRLNLIREAVRNYAQNTNEEFRQVDIRNVITVPALARSSAMALGFQMLRDEGTIQASRTEGNNKYFRLTPPSVRG